MFVSASARHSRANSNSAGRVVGSLHPINLTVPAFTKEQCAMGRGTERSTAEDRLFEIVNGNALEAC